MGLKKYIFGSLILILAVTGYAFTLESGDYRVQILEYGIVLPVAVWVAIPVAILFLASLLHLIYYGMKNYLSFKAINKDSNSTVKFLQKKILNLSSDATFKNPQFKQLNEILSNLEIKAVKNFNTDNKEFNKIVDNIVDINQGRYVSSKDLKLPNDNPLMIKNLINRVNSDDNFALEAVKKEKGYDRSVVVSAFNKILETKSMTTVKKNLDEIEFDKGMVISLFKKDSGQDAEFSLTNELISNLIFKVEMTNKDLIEVAKIYKKTMTPDQIISLFENLSTKKDEYTGAYLYVLCEYQVTDKIKDILANSSSEEFIPYKALMDLKEAGKHSYTIESISYK